MGSFISGLSEEPLDDLIIAAQDNPSDDSPAMNEIVRRFGVRAGVVARRLTDISSLHDDLTQACLIALVQAVRHHQRGRAGFVAYATTYMLGAARRTLNSWLRAFPASESLSDPAVWSAACHVAATPATVGTRCWGHGSVARAVLTLPEVQRDLLRQRYIDDAALATIAARSGTTVAAVSQRLATVHRGVMKALAA